MTRTRLPATNSLKSPAFQLFRRGKMDEQELLAAIVESNRKSCPPPDILDQLPSLLGLREPPSAEVYAALREFIRSDAMELQLPWMDEGQRHVMHTICDAIGLGHESRGDEAYRGRLMFVSRPSADWRMPESVEPIPRLGRRRRTPSAVPVLAADVPSCAACGREPDEDTRLICLPSGAISCVKCLSEQPALIDPAPDDPQLTILPQGHAVNFGARPVETAR